MVNISAEEVGEPRVSEECTFVIFGSIGILSLQDLIDHLASKIGRTRSQTALQTESKVARIRRTKNLVARLTISTGFGGDKVF